MFSNPVHPRSDLGRELLQVQPYRPRVSRMLFLDVGLMHASLNIEKEKEQRPELLGVHRGAVAEQFVGREFLACTPPNREPDAA